MPLRDQSRLDGDDTHLALPELAQLDEVLRDLGNALLALVDLPARPVDQVLVDLLERFRVVVRQSDLLPHVLGRMCSLDRLHVEVESALVLADGRIARIGERARCPVAETRDVVLIPTEVLRRRLDFVAAERVADHIPDLLGVSRAFVDCLTRSSACILMCYRRAAVDLQDLLASAAETTADSASRGCKTHSPTHRE